MPARAAIVLAAGKGKRMKSDLPKVLHEIGDQPMIRILMGTLVDLGLDRIVVVVGHKGELVQQALADFGVRTVWQREQLGTGHAVLQTEPLMADFDGTTLVAMGDVPFLSAQSINDLFEVHERNRAAATCLSALVDDPSGYGRVVRDGNSDLMLEIVEHKDASDEIKAIREINSGTFCFDNGSLFAALKRVGNDNAQGEYYLPDTIKIMRGEGRRAAVVTAADASEVLGVNSVDQLQDLARRFGYA